MTVKEILGALSIAFSVVGYYTYFRSIFCGKTKPHMFSWVVWGTVSGVAFCAQLSQHGGPGAWSVGVVTIVCYIVAVIAFFRGEKNITRGDWACLVGAFAAIPLWYLTREPLWSVILVVIVDLFGFYPTMRKSFVRPYEESTIMYGFDCGRFLTSLLALENYSLTTTLYPVAAFAFNGALFTMILWRRSMLKRPTK